MHGFDPFTSFGEEVAATYDDTLRGDETETVAFLRELAGSGPALELAIGTGRIGLPLRRHTSPPKRPRPTESFSTSGGTTSRRNY